MSPSRPRIGYYQKNINLGGVGRYILTLAEGLGRNCDVLIYMEEQAGAEANNFLDKLKALGAEPRFINQQGVPCMGRQAALPPAVSAGKTPRKKAFSALIPDFIKNWIYEKRLINQVMLALEREKLDILHFNLGYFPSLPRIMAAAAKARIPCKILTVHSMSTENPLKKIPAAVMAAFNHVIAVNERIKKKLTEHYAFLEGRTSVIYNGIKPQAFQMDGVLQKRKALGICEDEKLVLFPARLDALKGHETLFEALKKMDDCRVSFKIFLAGDGFNRSSFESAAALFGGKIIFGGYRTDMEMLYRACDLVLLPSLLEGFPFVLLEAMAAGKPVLATEVGEVRKMVGEEAGVLVLPGDADALAKALRQMLQESSSQFKMRGENGMHRVRELYPVSKMLAETYRCYGNGF